MPHTNVQRLHQWLQAHEDELLNEYVACLQFPSVKSAAIEGAPYGQPCRDVLDWALDLAKSFGMRTVDLDHQVGYAEFGSGTPMIASLGHLDVVPVGDGWKFPPFSATVSEGYVYARGAVDDKGPTIASLFAMRAIQNVLPDLPVRFRAVFGCDEESGMACVERYARTEETPTFGVAPDSAWPLIHGEKGIADLFIDVPIPASDFRLLSIEGGHRLNIVIDHCRATVSVAPTAKTEVEEKLAENWDQNVRTMWESAETLIIEASGKAAHGATPWLGDSAASRVFRLLLSLSTLDSREFYENLLWMAHPSGVGLGIHGADEPSRDLTSNLGIVATHDEAVRLSVNVRYPVTWKGDDVRNRCQAWLDEKSPGAKVADFHDSPPLYFALDSPLVETIIDAYREETGDMTAPGVMGGGTYARKLPNTVSIGTGWLGDGEAHQTNERLKVDHLFKMSRIYAAILYKLALRATMES